MALAKHLIFDVDGTLIDPWVGLTRSVASAFEKMGREYKSEHDMRWFVGPPLSECFAELLDTDDPTIIAEAVSLYRLRFESHGIAECTVYPGIKELLAHCARDCKLFVATARIQRFTDMMLTHFELAPFFTRAYGTGPNGRFNDKADLLQHILEAHDLDPSECLMIGDRRHDIAAAKANNVQSVAVSYGYGVKDELLSAGADWVVDSVDSLRRLLLQTQSEEK